MNHCNNYQIYNSTGENQLLTPIISQAQHHYCPQTAKTRTCSRIWPAMAIQTSKLSYGTGPAKNVQIQSMKKLLTWSVGQVQNQHLKCGNSPKRNQTCFRTPHTLLITHQIRCSHKFAAFMHSAHKPDLDPKIEDENTELNI